MSSKAPPKRHVYRQIGLLLLLLVGLYVFIPQIGSFQHSLNWLAKAKVADLAKAATWIGLSFLAAAGTYYFLAFRRLAYAQIVVVQLAANFVNRLLPGGIGALGANYVYLRRNRHSSSQAGAAVAANNAIGVVAHILLLALSLLVFGRQLPPLHLAHVRPAELWAVAGLAVVIVSILWVKRRWRRHFMHSVMQLVKQLAYYRTQPQKLGGALLTSAGVTLCNVLSLLFCVQALHAQLPFAVILIVFSVAVSLGTATPTPGGLGGFEAGLVAGLVAYGMSGALALAIALAYRLVSYWLPLVVGAVAFVVARHKRLLSLEY